MKFQDWLIKKVEGINLTFMAAYLNIDYQKLINILNGQWLPDYLFVFQLIYYFKLNSDEQLELFYLVGETLNVSADQVFKGVVNEMVALTNDNSEPQR